VIQDDEGAEREAPSPPTLFLPPTALAPSSLPPRAVDVLALGVQCWTWSRGILATILPLGDAVGYATFFIVAVVTFVQARVRDLHVALNLVQRSYYAETGGGSLQDNKAALGKVAMEAGRSLWEDVPPSVALTVAGTAAAALVLSRRGGRRVVLAAADTAVATALIVVIGCAVFAVPIAALALALAAGLAFSAWAFFIVWRAGEGRNGALRRRSVSLSLSSLSLSLPSLSPLFPLSLSLSLPPPISLPLPPQLFSISLSLYPSPAGTWSRLPS